MSQRKKILQNKHDKNIRALFQDLRKPQRDQIEFLKEVKKFTPLAYDRAEQLVHLDDEVLSTGSSHWLVDDVPAHISVQHPDLVSLVIPDDFGEDSILEQTVVHATPVDVHHELGQFWKTRWNTENPPSASEWSRISSFVQSEMPSYNFDFPPITVSQWRRSVRRFKPHAARGADGFAKDDLQHMNDRQIASLLSLIEAVEHDRTGWPIQLLESFVIALAKVDHAYSPSQFRPVVLFSMIYRCWSSIRARQALRQLRTVIHEDAYGSIPGREPAMVWMLTLAMVEQSLLHQQPLGGLSTDVVRAFNNIQRGPLFTLLEHLSGFTRRFQVMHQLSKPYESNIGFPEGCPLSVVAMAAVDWTMHT